MRNPLPVWSIPFLLALMGIVALVGHLGIAALAVASLETVAVCVYLVIQAKRPQAGPQPTSNLLALFPGHLLVLIILALLDRPGGLAWMWTVVPAATLVYDAVGRSSNLSKGVRLSISAILYGILWADLFFLIERAAILHRQSSGKQEIMIAVAFGLVGALFLSLGVYRHRIAAKE